MFSDLREHELVQWTIMGLSVIAFIVAVKAGASYLPESNPFTRAVKHVILAV